MIQFYKNLSLSTKALIIFSIIACIVYWDIGCLQRTLKWDMIDGNYPFQSLQSQLEKQGELPLWDSYSKFGFAIHSKMSSWYPIRFLSCKLSLFTLTKLNFEFLFHLILAGMGMFLIAKKLKFEFYISIGLGLAYMLSGFFSGNAQHMGWIISGALFPYILLIYYELISKPQFKTSLLFAFVTFSFIVGGYPAFTIVVFYLLFFYFLWKIISIIRAKKYGELTSIVVAHFAVVVPLLLLLSITITSYSDMVHNVTRGNGISLDYVIENSIELKHFITFIIPFFIAFQTNILINNNVALMNCYMGISIFILAIYSIRLYRKKHIQYLWIITLFFIALSFAKDIPLRSFFYNHIPLFNLFRFPSLFRLFFMFSMILLAGFSLQEIQNKYSPRILLRTSTILAILFSVILVVLLFRFNLFQFAHYWGWHDILLTFTKPQIAFIQLFMWAGIAVTTSIVGYILVKKNHRYSFQIIFLTFLGLELIFASLLNSAVSVTYPLNPIKTQQIVNALPSNFPQRNITEPTISQNDTILKITGPIVRNNQIFHKQMTYDSYSSYEYTSTEKFQNSNIYDSVKIYPLAYIPSFAYSETDSIFNYKTGKIAVISNSKQHSINPNHSLKITHSKPNEFVFSVQTSDSIPLVLMQNKYPGWQVFINGKEHKILLANYFCMSVMVPPGKSEIKFLYAPQKIVASYYIFEYSLYCIILLLLLLFLPTFYSKFKPLKKE